MNYNFGLNDWVMIVSSFVVFCIFLMIRKHFHPIVIIVIWIFMIAFVEAIDYFLAASPFKVYYCGDNITYEPATGVIHLFLYPGYSFIFLYMYDKWNIRGLNLILYCACWTVFSIGFEWFFLVTKVFTYTGWKLYYSILVYPLSNFILIWLFHFIKKNLVKST